MPEPLTATALAALAIQLVIPLLRKAGENVAEGAVTRVGEALTEGVGSGTVKLWRAIKGRLTGAGAEAVAELEAAPADPDAEAVLRVQLRKALEADPTWQTEIADLVEHSKAEDAAIGQRMTIAGNDDIAVQNQGSGNTFTIRGRGPDT